MSKKKQIIEPELLLGFYAQGIFPMAMEDGLISWFSPDPRGVIPLENFSAPHGMKKILKKNPYKIMINKNFKAVIKNCANRQETWINEMILDTYLELHRLGYAHSVESWEGLKLIGGLYGVSIGGAFFGESMFSKKTEASKIALVNLIEHLQKKKFLLLDTQWTTSHLRMFGGVEIARKTYLKLLSKAIKIKTNFI